MALQLEPVVNTGSAFAQGQQLVPDFASQMAQRQMQQIQLQDAQQQLAMRQIAFQRQQTFGRDMGTFLQNPSAQGVAQLFGKYPEFAKQIGDSWSTIDTAQKRADLTQLGSAASLMSGGDWDGASKLIQTRIDADKAAGRDTTSLEQMLQEVQSGDPQRQKAALGMTASMIAGALPPDKIEESLSALGLSRKPITVGMDQRLVSPQGETIVGGTPKLEHVEVTNPDGSTTSTTFNPITGEYGAAGAGGSAPAPQSQGGGGPASGGGAAAPAGSPRSVRNNNPGNLKASPFTRNQAGYQGVDDAGYAIFDNPQNGLNAQTALLNGKGYYGGGRQTVASIVSKWAPPTTAGGDNTPAQTANYVKYVSAKLGVKPGQKLDPSQLPALAQAMSQFEAGTTGQAGSVRVPPANVGASPAGGPAAAPAAAPQSSPYQFGGQAGGLNTKGAEPGHAWNPTHTGEIPVPGSDADPAAYQATIHPAALHWLFTNEFPTGGGGMGGGGQLTIGEKNAIVKDAMATWAAAGHNPAELKTFRAQYAGLNDSIQKTTTTVSNYQAMQEALEKDANLALAAHRNLINLTANNRLFHIRDGGLFSNTANEKTINYLAENGTPQEQQAAKQFKDAMNAYGVTYAKFMSAGTAGNTSSAGPTDSAGAKAEELNDIGMGPTALRAHLQMINAEAGNKTQGFQKQLAILNNRMSGLVGLGQSQPSQAPINIPAGAVQMLKANPNLAPLFDQKYGAGKASQILGR